jgi:uncharacterized membrane protein YsdA (DUF1294 family)
MHKFFRNVSEKLLWFITILFGYLGYLAKIRIYFLDNYGYYSVGFLDCLIVMATLIAVLFYYLSVRVCKR